MKNYRPDIQALRGLAVLLVVLFHADIAWFDHGYLGVDVFFVISGYLITGQLVAQMSSGRFSFSRFYYRRALRLLPAAYVVLVACLLIAPFLLLDAQLSDFSAQVIGALSFSANFVLLGQTGYFETSANHQLLLHFWSLSLEEQYYLLIPFLLLIFGRFRYAMVSAITLLSLAAYLQISLTQPEVSFFLLPTRMWELGFGSLLALSPEIQKSLQDSRHGPVITFIAVLCLRLIPVMWQSTGLRSELAAVMICLATTVVIGTRQRWLNHGMIIAGLALLGAISYSVYLVHWPIFAFIHNANIQAGLWWPIRLAAVISSLVIGWLLYQYVEQRYRLRNDESDTAKPSPAALLLIPLFLMLVSGGQYMWAQKSPDLKRLDGVVGLSANCHLSEVLFTAECQSDADPQLLVWGDSYAQHLIPGLLHQGATTTIAQATKSTCAPVIDLTLGDRARFNRKWAQSCHDFNNAVLSKVLQHQSIETIVLASQWFYLLNGESWDFSTAQASLNRLTPQQILQRVQATVSQLRAAGKRVVVVAPPPPPQFDAGKCVMRLRSGKPGFGVDADCSIARQENTILVQFLDELESRKIAPAYRFESLLCDSQHCRSQVGETIIYRDVGHLSNEGSAYLGRLENWPQRFSEMAY